MPVLKCGEVWKNRRGDWGTVEVRSVPIDDEDVRKLLPPADRVTTPDRFPFVWIKHDGSIAYTVTEFGNYDMVAGSPCPHETEYDLVERVAE